MRPHSAFRRLVSLLLAVLVLTASVGFTVQRMTCRMSGREAVTVSVAGQTDQPGCSEALVPAAPVAKGNCCDVSQQLHKLTVPAHFLTAKVVVPTLLAVEMPLLSWRAAPAALVPAGQAPRWFAADASPPPLGGRGLLAFVCTLVV